MTITAEEAFCAASSTISDRWSAIRQIMAARTFSQFIDKPEFREGWNAVIAGAPRAQGIERLLHIDLLIRVSSYAKKLKPEAEAAIAGILKEPLIDVSTISESGILPTDAKPAEIRENIAVALQYSRDEWVTSYVIRALAGEDRSQRCRQRFVERLVERSPEVDAWFRNLSQESELRTLCANGGMANACRRLKGLASALGSGIRENRTTVNVTEEAGVELANLARSTIQVGGNDILPNSLGSTAAELAQLLDDLLSARLTLIVQPRAYSLLSVFRAWWGKVPYPAELNTAMGPVLSKIDTALTIRAQAGQKSQGLSAKLAEGLGNKERSKKWLLTIADKHPELHPQVDDWLRGRTRVETVSGRAAANALQGVEERSLLTRFAELLLLSFEESEQQDRSRSEGYSAGSRLHNEIAAIARESALETFGRIGEQVEYLGELHVTEDEQLPDDARVTVSRPGVKRKRVGGGEEILIRAVVR